MCSYFLYLCLDSFFVSMIASPDGAVGEPPTGGERGYGGRQCPWPLTHQLPARRSSARPGDRPLWPYHAAVALAAAQVL